MGNQPSENNAARRHEVMYRLWNSYWLEHIVEVFNRRMDTVINAVILTLGATVFADSNFSWLLGGIVAVLSGCNIAWKFGQRAEAAKAQAHRYSVLISESGNLSTEDVLNRLLETEKQDSPVIEGMDAVARNKASASMGLKHRDQLSLPQKIIALLTVGNPG
ncbi:TPA: hypothetical protein ACI7JC_000957 [Escherichia coli]|uniref:hypothetical protein n=1 Tax=Escherichia coli TaxID=562 RepID=UPI0006A1DABD|nr:hypothetical protein [Escherichia coli]EGT2566880.1 hypothetical protein [Escherichia coli]EHT3012966.1 hypothetical protein [Escherichia coli]EHU5686693.1 hypothetical protein [Escherichia coli]EHY4016148.1 hypothetical protein [Escherichia coli]CTT86632.1 Uncharacterised protein [Escherichia coli]